jgi:hypothetical protein
VPSVFYTQSVSGKFEMLIWGNKRSPGISAHLEVYCEKNDVDDEEFYINENFQNDWRYSYL